MHLCRRNDCRPLTVCAACMPLLSQQFDHPNFRRGREDLLHLITRKSGGGGGGGGGAGTSGGAANKAHAGGAQEKGGEAYREEIKELSEQVRSLKAQYSELAKMQQRILYVFGRYVNGGNDSPSRKRFVSDRSADERGSGGSAAKKARLLLQNRESSGDSQEARPRRTGTPTFSNALADIDWNDAHAMQDLIHSPYLRGAPQVLNNTPIPMELPPLQGHQTSSNTRSPRPLLLTGGGEDERWTDGLRRLTIPAVDVQHPQRPNRARGVFYDAGEHSPSSQSSTCTEDGHDRGIAHRSADPFTHASSFAPTTADVREWATSAHRAPNGVIYAPPSMSSAGRPAQVKVEDELEPPSPTSYGFSLPSTPPPIGRGPSAAAPAAGARPVHALLLPPLPTAFRGRRLAWSVPVELQRSADSVLSRTAAAASAHSDGVPHSSHP